ncbi:PLC-like phosphodiesterase [Hypoxylon sp. NC1633]|nr:PLC-like phosphodiesterase [Hypoxylon sp. NC1633]
MRGSIILLSCIAAKAAADLSQFALQKVLHDAEEVFGPASQSAGRPSNASLPYANWMAKLPDVTPLARLNIPGIHDAATWNYTSATQAALTPATRCDGVPINPPQTYRCQQRPIGAALDAGVRFVDLRFALGPDEADLAFWHGAALVSARAGVEGVMFAFYDWLDAHPMETLLVSFMYEGGTRAGAAFGERAQLLLRMALGTGAARTYVRQDRGIGGLGTLGESRGKIVLLRRFDIQGEGLPGLHLSPALWPDNEPAGFALTYDEATNATAFVEDYYEPVGLAANSSVPENVAAKMSAVRAHLRKAAEEEEEEEDSLFITFASGEHNANQPPVYPETMALGNGTRVTPDGGVNHQLASVLREMRGSRLGVVVLDFFDEPADLVGLVIGS